MTQQIRRAAFETNSSSSHSITIALGDYVPDALPVIDGVCEIHTGEFGWEIEDYSDAATKAAYCLTWIKGYAGADEERCAEMLVRVVKRVTGAKEVRFVPESDEPDGSWGKWGYIDHQSSDVAAEAFQSDDTLAQFIFNERSRLHTDNDNH